jgi:hypothetical protein
MSAATASAVVPAPVERSRVRVIFAGLMLVLPLAALDQTIVATALPTIVGDLGGLDRLAWETSAFLLAQTRHFRERLAARAGVDLSPGATWGLVRIDEHGFARARELAEHDGVPPERLAAVVGELRRGGLVAGEDAGLALTSAGHDLARRAVVARRELLSEALADEAADRNPVVNELLRRLARELAGDRP